MSTTQPGDPSLPPAALPVPIPQAAGDAAAGLISQNHNAGHSNEKSPPSLNSSDTATVDREQEKERENDVFQLARTITRKSIRRTSTLGGNYQVPFAGVEKDSLLDPNGPNFNAKAWYKNLVGVQSRDPERYPQRTAGISFRNLNVHGFGTPADYQKDVGNVLLEAGSLVRWMTGSGKTKIQILQGFDGYVESGEMLVVLGRPGSGCSTLLKTFAGETYGFYVDEKSSINYQGISAKKMHNHFRGEAIYMAETDVHFPQMTVGETLAFAAKARAPRDNLFPGVTRSQYAEHMRDVVMAMFGIKHTINTRVGNDFVRGVSGGERKRVSISEAALSGSPLQCWDNSTRGLDSANAIEFCKTLRLSTSLAGATACVAIYQAPQTAYDVFDKVTVLYEGRQIYFGKIHDAKAFFVDMGFECPARQTTPDFLTSLTSPEERVIRPGFENKTPRTPDEFVQAWKSSPEYAKLIEEINAYDQKYPVGGESLQRFEASRRAQQAKSQRIRSPYTLSVKQQVALCIERGFIRLKGDASVTITGLFGNNIMALIVSSIFFNLQPTTATFYSRGALLFFAVLLNAFASVLEILTLYAQRPIVEKHTRYALYHPFSEALASMLCDMPYKITNSIIFNLILYFMTNLRREPGAFFTFLLFSFSATLTMSMMFRTIAATSRTLVQALTPAAVIILALVIYTGFVIPPTGMVVWFRWINYINPIAYVFESLMVNEFHNRNFECVGFVPAGGPYDTVPLANRICSTVGAVAGSPFVNGDAYVGKSFDYRNSHKWRNLGITFGFMLFFMFTYLFATEYVSAQKSKGEVLLFRRGHLPTSRKAQDLEEARKDRDQVETELNRQVTATIQRQTAIFQWQNICYDIKIKKESRRILDHVDGWVKPGTLTALMGPSGAGKTTLLDVLATRVTMGVVTGEALVDGRQRDTSFQRKTGYVQQQDLHLQTSTVRESLEFSALMRQAAHIPRKEKLEYVEEVIKLLGMETYADAVVGVPGEGLNVEQRKRLTIGVELAARPQLLLFLDEPTSGLDSQTSWSILDLLEKLTAHGQAILCTIHQPSAMLFQRFDRLLFLAPGGKTVYFGGIGEHSKTLTNYFEKNGAEPCPPEENPAEWMMATIGCAPGAYSEIDWPAVWRESPERAEVQNELEHMKVNLRQKSVPDHDAANKAEYQEFAAPFRVQCWEVFKRVNAQYWRTPSYIYSKIALTVLTALFIGFTFWKSPLSQQGLQNQMFSIFMLVTIFGNLSQQIMPNFVTQRSLYEARERPSKTYSWKVFMLSNVVVELPWNSLMAALMYFCWYYPIGFQRNAAQTDTVTERGALMFLYIWIFFMWISTLSHALIAGIDLAETAGNFGNLLFSLSLVFCGVLASPDVFPRFWIFMYRVSPFTYLIDGVLSTGLANTKVTCAPIEILHFDPLNGTCTEYLAPYINAAGGYLNNPDATSNCEFCTISNTNAFLATIKSSYSHRWRNWGILWVYIIVNIAAAVLFYWLMRVPKKGNQVKESTDPSLALVKTKSNRHQEAEIETTNEKENKKEGEVIA